MPKQPIIARFQFKPNRAEEFAIKSEFTELQFDTVEEVMELCEEFRAALVDVTANINGRIINLSSQPKE